ncbi:MAG: DUF4212 domain-containing protein [Bacteroidales bacterium]|nr:DUF4212 domain-containing protein [Bacteroidales bacterium]
MEKNSEQEKRYDISFFKPTTELAKRNRTLAMWLLLLWVIAIFGFHTLLKVIEKPTAEPVYTSFESVWQNVKAGNASVQEQKDFAQSTLTVLCKVFITPEERAILDNAFGSTFFSLLSDDKKDEVLNEIQLFKTYEFGTEEYNASKLKLAGIVSETIGVENYSLQAKISPLELNPENISEFQTENVDQLESVMQKYLIHNQSFLTDTNFLGFPFHYFYTAVFLLILFVGICWFYCVRTDKIMKELGIEETVS